MRRLRTGVLLAAAMLVAVPAWAQSLGTPAEATAVLEKVSASLKANQAQTLTQITKGDYKDRDLYPFCGGPDGKYSAHGANPALVGQDLRALKDKSGKPIGEEIYSTATAGKIGEVSYMWPRPGETDPVQKVTFVTKVGDQVCAVGYYK